MFGSYLKGECVMGMNDRIQNAKADKKAAKAAERPASDGWKGFVNLELSDAQKAEAKKLLADADRVTDNVWKLVDDGYKVSFSYDGYHGAYLCAVTCQDKSSVNVGLTLTGRGGGILAAMASLWYKHDVVLERNWTSMSVQGPRGMALDELG